MPRLHLTDVVVQRLKPSLYRSIFGGLMISTSSRVSRPFRATTNRSSTASGVTRNLPLSGRHTSSPPIGRRRRESCGGAEATFRAPASNQTVSVNPTLIAWSSAAESTTQLVCMARCRLVVCHQSIPLGPLPPGEPQAARQARMPRRMHVLPLDVD